MVSSMRAPTGAVDGAPPGPRAATGEGRRRTGLYVAVVAACGAGVLILALWFGGSGPQTRITGLPSAGPLVTWSLPLMRLVLDVCAMLTVGALVTGVVLVPSTSGRLGDAGVRCVRAAAAWALGWALSAALSLVLTLADIMGVPPTRLASTGSVASLAWSIPQGRAFAVVAVTALIIAAACRGVSRRAGGGAVLAVAVLGLLPPVYAGHSASSADHDVAVSSMMVHGVAVSVWAGGLIAVLLYLRRSPGLLPAGVTRFSSVALGCFAAAGLSGLANVWTRLDSAGLLWTSRYGLLLTAKILALVALGYFGWRHRRRTIAALVDGRSARPFLRLAAGEVIVMVATIGLAVALSRTAPPPRTGALSWIELQLGYDVPPLTPSRLITEWRPDPLMMVVLISAGLAYVAGVRRLRRQGTAWPGERLVAWFAGLGVLSLVLLSGVATYARAMFSVHLAQHLALTVLAPVLLAYGAPVTLALRARGRGADALDTRPLWLATRPAVTFTAYAAPFVLFYFTDWFTLAQWSHAAHLVSQAVFLITGLVYFWVVLGIDPVPAGDTVDGQTRGRLLLAGLPVHVLLSAMLVDGPIVGESWYRQLGLMWAMPGGERGGGLIAESASLAADQRIGAAIGGIGALSIFLVILCALGLRQRALRGAGRG
jgi:putative copper resistance protein D